jgi:hypothetical protein
MVVIHNTTWIMIIGSGSAAGCAESLWLSVADNS